MQRYMEVSLEFSHGLHFVVTADANAERHTMIVGDDSTGYATVLADQDILLVCEYPIRQRIELEVRVQHSYYVDATDRIMYHLFPRVPLVGNHCRLAHLEYFGINSYVYFECLESNGTTFMFVARIERWWVE